MTFPSPSNGKPCLNLNCRHISSVLLALVLIQSVLSEENQDPCQHRDDLQRLLRNRWTRTHLQVIVPTPLNQVGRDRCLCLANTVFPTAATAEILLPINPSSKRVHWAPTSVERNTPLSRARYIVGRAWELLSLCFIHYYQPNGTSFWAGTEGFPGLALIG